jgi:hypothetical protein
MIKELNYSSLWQSTIIVFIFYFNSKEGRSFDHVRLLLII